MANYLKAIPGLLEREAPYDNDPDDPGEETVWGITKKDHPKDPIWKLVDELRGFPGFPGCVGASTAIKQAAIDHYKPNYWDKMRGDEIENQAVAEELFDTAVNCGIETGIGILERLLNDGNRNQADYPDVIADGRFDDTDMKHLSLLIAKRGAASVVKALNIFQGARYRDICEKGGKMEKYFWGWIINRA